MSLDDPASIDLVSMDATEAMVTLSIVAERPWGARGDLLPALNAKLNTYLSWVLTGGLVQHYPEASGKQVSFCLHYADPPGVEEQHMIDHIVANYLTPQGIAWVQRPLPSG